jgi:hypothetical protein
MEKMLSDIPNQRNQRGSYPVRPQDDRQAIIDNNAVYVNYVICWVGIVVYFVVIGYLVQMCWNYIAPDIFKLGKLDYKRAIALVVVWKLLNLGDVNYSYSQNKNVNITGAENFRQ